jgi:hypothetical protein
VYIENKYIQSIYKRLIKHTDISGAGAFLTHSF